LTFQDGRLCIVIKHVANVVIVGDVEVDV